MDLAASVEPRPDTIEALWATALSAGVAADFATPLAIGRRLLAWGEEHGDPLALCLGHTLVGAYSFYLADLDTSARHLDLAVEVVDTAGLDLRFFYDGTLAGGVSMVAMRAHVAWSVGRNDEATALIADASHRAERLGHEIGVLFALCWDVWLAVYRHDFDVARTQAGGLVVGADALAYRQVLVMGGILAASAHEDPSVRASELHQAVAAWEATGALVFQTFYRTLQAEAEIDLGRFEQARAHLTRALDAATTTGERFYEPEIHRLLGLVALGQGRPEEATRHYVRGSAVAGELGLVALGERVAVSLAKLRTDTALRIE